jgi:DNA-binding MarR family transcriptional regulator
VCSGTGAAVGKLAERLKHAGRVYICFDSDDPGKKAAKELADILGPRARVVQLPEFSLPGVQPGKDLNDYLVSGATEEDFGRLLESAPTLAELLIAEIPEDVDPIRLPEKLEPALRQLARGTDSEARAILECRAKIRFGFGARMIDSLMTDVRKLRKQLDREAAANAELGADDSSDDSPPDLTLAEIEQAEAVLRAPDLIDQISRDIRALGVVGEEKTALLLYLAMTSRKSLKPISVELRGHSGAGKSFLVQTILSLMPESEVVSHTRVTPRYLEHLPQGYLKHKVLFISEAAGGEGAELAVRMMADDTSARIELGYVRENPKTGEHESVTKIVEGPMSLIQTSTRTGANPEDESRWWILEADDSAEQRKRIQKAILATALPHKTLSPAVRDDILARHRNLQRLLKPYDVTIPYAELIEFPADLYRSNRDLKRFVNVISASAILHQCQRQRITMGGREMLLADVRDYEAAYNACVGAVVGSRERLPGRSRELLAGAEQLLKVKRDEGDADPHLTRADLAELPGWDDHTVARAVKPLEGRGYVEFKPGTKPYRYRVRRGVPVEPTVEGILTPAEMRRKIAENLDKIDPGYLGASEMDSAHFADFAPECLSRTTHTAFRPDDQGLASNQASLEIEDGAFARVCGEKGSIPVRNVQDAWQTTGGDG